jgi:hypothetical protein
MQEQFIKYLKAEAQDNTSFVEDIASVLDIGYDAAYRRINNKTNLSLEESVILARHYKISLNKLFEVGNQNTIVAEVSPPIRNEAGLEVYYKKSLENILQLVKVKNAEIIYSAKDIPFFHTLKDTYLTRYKMYVWLKDLNIEMAKSKITFEEWVKTVPDSLLQSAYDLSEVYNYINISELWNDSTITGTLQQVLYYYEAGLVKKEMALKICEDIDEVINHTEKQTIQQSLTGSKSKNSYHLYKCDLHMLSNTIMVKTPLQKVFFIPFTILSYFKIDNQSVCNMMYEFFQKQMSISKLLANAGERDRTLFFNKIHKKIQIAKERIKMDEKMAFL